MSRRKVRIAKIENKASRPVTFTKRRHGIFKKARELCVLCDAEIAILTFSPAGKPFAFSHPGIESLVSRCRFNRPAPASSEATASSVPASSETTVLSQIPQVKPHDFNGNVGAAGYWWELVNVDDFVDESNLYQLKNALEELRQGVYALLGLNLYESALNSLPGGASSSSLPGTTGAFLEFCSSLPQLMQGNFGGQSADFIIRGSPPQVTDLSSILQDLKQIYPGLETHNSNRF